MKRISNEKSIKYLLQPWIQKNRRESRELTTHKIVSISPCFVSKKDSAFMTIHVSATFISYPTAAVIRFVSVSGSEETEIGREIYMNT